MSSVNLFRIHLVLGYVAWLLCFSVYFLAQAQVDGPIRSPSRHRHPAQLSLLRARLYPSGRRRAESARRLRHLRRLWRLCNRSAGHSGASHRKVSSALLVVCSRLQFRGGDRHHRRLLPRHSGWPSCDAGQLGAAYCIPIIYVPLLMITHFVAFYLLLRRVSQ